MLLLLFIAFMNKLMYKSTKPNRDHMGPQTWESGTPGSGSLTHRKSGARDGTVTQYIGAVE